jgi:hypothetical protein
MEKTIDIFIRTYSKDLEWLAYCLKSIDKFVTGHRNIIISIPEQEKHLLKPFNLTKELIVAWKPTTDNGYIDQQINKLLAYKYTDADYILFVDSDCLFKEPVNVQDHYFMDNLPYLMKTRYELVGDAICWKEATQDIIGKELEYEYMRRIPCLFRTETLKSLDLYVNCLGLAGLSRLSEFNLIGAYIDFFEKESYKIIDTEKEPIPADCAMQLWSWGGLTNEVKEKLCSYLN